MTFTEKEREVLELLAQGLNIKEAAHALDIHYSSERANPRSSAFWFFRAVFGIRRPGTTKCAKRLR